MSWEASYLWERAITEGRESVGGILLGLPEFAFLSLARRARPTRILVQALDYLSQGIKDVEAAEISKITPEGAKTRRRYAKQKIGARTNIHAVSISLHNGWLPYENTQERHTEQLSPMQEKVLRLGALGLNVYEIGKVFEVSRWTIDTHFGEVLARKQASSRPHSILRAYQDGTFAPGGVILDTNLADEIGSKSAMLASAWGK